MAVIKIACSKCGQRVSGDESFYGTTVECPVCSSIIAFPEPELSNQAPPPSQEQPLPDTADTVDNSGDPGMPSLGGHREGEPSLQTTSIPLQPENIVTQNSARIGALNAAMDSNVPEEEPPSALLSVLSMVFGILGLVFFFVGASLLCAPAAIILGHIALSKAKHSRIQPAPGQTMAMIGVILGYSGLLLSAILVATYDYWSPMVPKILG